MAWGRPGENYNTFAEELKEKKSHAYRLSIMKPYTDSKPPKGFGKKRNDAVAKMQKEARFREIEKQNRFLLDKMSKLMTKSSPSFPSAKVNTTAKPCSSLNKTKEKFEKQRITAANDRLLKRIEGGKSVYSRKKWAQDRKTNEYYLKNLSKDTRFRPGGADIATGLSPKNGKSGGGKKTRRGGGGSGGLGQKLPARGGPVSKSTLQSAREMHARLHDPDIVSTDSPYAMAVGTDTFKARELDGHSHTSPSGGNEYGGEASVPGRLPKLVAMPPVGNNSVPLSSPQTTHGSGGAGAYGSGHGTEDEREGGMHGAAASHLTAGGEFLSDGEGMRSGGDGEGMRGGRGGAAGGAGGGDTFVSHSPEEGGGGSPGAGGSLRPAPTGSRAGKVAKRVRPGQKKNTGGGARGSDKEILNIGRNICGVFSVVSVFARGRRLIFQVHVPSDCEQYVLKVARSMP